MLNAESIAQKLNAVQTIQRYLKEQNVNASGTLSNSVEMVVATNRITVFALEYFAKLKQGVGSNSTTYDAIRKWIDNKKLFLNKPKNIRNSIAFLITKKINTIGTNAFRNQNPYYNDPIGDAINEILQNLDKTLQQETNNTLQAIVNTFN